MPVISSVYEMSLGETWSSTRPNLPNIREQGNAYCNGAYNFNSMQCVGGDGSVAVATNYEFNGNSWLTIANSNHAARTNPQGSQFNGFFYLDGGSTANVSEKWNNSSWATKTAPSLTGGFGGTQFDAALGFWYSLLGQNAGTAADSTTRMNAAEVTTAVTASGITRTEQGVCNLPGKIYKIGGVSTAGTAGTADPSNYSWNESAWTAEAVQATTIWRAFALRRNNGFYNGTGANGAGTRQAVVQFYNGVSWRSVTNYPISVSQGAGASSTGAVV